MARITVEDCLQNVDNRFELVLVSSKRARQLMSGTKEAQIDWENDKATVVALREIEQGLVNANILDEADQDDYFDEPPTPLQGEDAELAALMGELVGDSSQPEASSPIEAELAGLLNASPAEEPQGESGDSEAVLPPEESQDDSE